MLNLSLHDRWITFWNEIGAVGDPNIPWTDLAARYHERGRAYHTLAHIADVFYEFDAFRAADEMRLVDQNIVQMAIWYHDAIYDPRAKDNEEKSAELFRFVAQRAALGENFIREVVRAILATKHTAEPGNFNSRLLCDLDLSILGQPEADFAEYEERIRREYRWAPDEEFRKGRLAILQAFCQRETIYATEFFRDRYEAQARRNLVRSIMQLSDRL